MHRPVLRPIHLRHPECERKREPARLPFAAKMLVLGLMAMVTAMAMGITMGCVSQDRGAPIQAGPTHGPDGAFRELQSAVTGQHEIWTATMLVSTFERSGRPDDLNTRLQMAPALVSRLGSLFRRSLVVTDAPEIAESQTAAVVTAHVTPIIAWDDGVALTEWATTATPPTAGGATTNNHTGTNSGTASAPESSSNGPPQPAVYTVRSEWVVEDEQWRLANLRVESPTGVWRLIADP